MQRDKGKRGEREAAAELVRLFRCEAYRGRQYQGGDDSPDVKASISNIHFEVKRTERLQVYAAMAQAMEDSGVLDIPVVLHRANAKPWLAIVRLADLPRLAEILFHQLAATN
jgi:Holliday junction resolvase